MCYKCATNVLQMGYKCATNVLQMCYKVRYIMYKKGCNYYYLFLLLSSDKIYVEYIF